MARCHNVLYSAIEVESWNNTHSLHRHTDQILFPLFSYLQSHFQKSKTVQNVLLCSYMEIIVCVLCCILEFPEALSYPWLLQGISKEEKGTGLVIDFHYFPNCKSPKGCFEKFMNFMNLDRHLVLSIRLSES